MIVFSISNLVKHHKIHNLHLIDVLSGSSTGKWERRWTLEPILTHSSDAHLNVIL
jgi:hypothetical protein